MPYTVNDHIKLGRVTSIAPSPDNLWLAVAVERLDRDGARYASDIWKLPTDGSPALQLTRGDSRDTHPQFRRDGALAFLSNRTPNEIKADDDADKRSQIWIFPPGGGEARQLTDEPLGVEDFRFARKADRLVFTTPVIPGVAPDKQREHAADRAKNGPSARRFTRQPVRHWDRWLHENPDFSNTHLIACDEQAGNRVDLTPDARAELAIDTAFAVSADGKTVAMKWQTYAADRALDSTILLVDIEPKTTRRFGVAPGVSNESVHFSPDGRLLATTRSFRSAKVAVRPELVLIEVSSGTERVVARNWDRWPQPQCWSNDGRQIIVTADDDGHTAAYAIDAASGEVSRITSRESGGTHGDVVALSDGRLAGIRSTLLDAPECFIVDLLPERDPKPLARLSGFKPAAWAEVESCSVPSTDGVPIQYFVVKPKGATKRLPTLLWIHGGPIGMDADGWHWRWNPLLAVAEGYAVALPNPRGSTGFGQEFIQGIWGNVWGGQCYRDLMCVVDSLERRADVDPKRIMAMGGSFGGYMTNWIGTQTQRFRCLITHASIFTMAQFTGVTDHPAWWYLEMGGEDPYADPRQFDRYAPVQHVKQWKTPTLIIHGDHDYRCPISEALNLFEALQYHGTPSELLIFPDEGHWVLKPRNIVVWYESVLEFLGKNMK